MNFTFSIFGNPNGYKQFLIESTNSNNQDFTQVHIYKDQLTYERYGQLVQYIYSHRLNNSGSYFGISLTFNGIHCKNPIKLFELFLSNMEKVIQRKKLFSYTQKEYFYEIQNFSDYKQEIERIKELFITGFENDFKEDFVPISGIVTDTKFEPIIFELPAKSDDIFVEMLKCSTVIIHEGERIIIQKPSRPPFSRKILYLLLLLSVLCIFFLIKKCNYTPTKYYLDRDGDGKGNVDSFIISSNPIDGYVGIKGDPDDSNPCIPDSSSKTCKDEVRFGGKENSKQPETKSCPSLNKNIGDLCSDGDSDTFDDRIDANCICKGKTGTVTWYQDRDGDGIGNQNIKKISNTVLSGYVTVSGDCDDNDKNIRKIGDLCDDNNQDTTNDKVQTDCVCRGTAKVTGDSDRDGVVDKSDKCPNRSGINSKSGCPEVKIKHISSVIKDQDVVVELNDFKSLPGDNIAWSVGTGSGAFVNPNAVKTTLRMKKPGLHTIQVNVHSTSDEFSDSDSKQICVEYSKDELSRIIDKAKNQGSYDPGTFIPSTVKADANDALEIFKEISATNIQIKENSSVFGNDIEDFILAKIMEPGSYLRSISVMPYYNTSTCKVERIIFNMK